MKGGFTCVPWGSAQEHAAVKWSYKGYDEPFILDFHSLVFISSLQKHMILKYVENNETKLLPKRHHFSLPQCLKSYIVEEWVVIYLSWFPFRRILAKKSDKYCGTFGVYFIQKYFGKKKTIFEILDRKVELVMKMWNEKPLTPLSLEFNLHFCGLIKIF